MSSDDLEGDDIWGDAGGSGGSGEAAAASGGTEQPSAEQQPEEAPEDDETRHMTIGELRQRIHLINKRPYCGSCYNGTGTSCRVVNKIAACAFVIVCV